MHKFRANEVAAQMYENKTLQITELNDIQDKYSRNDVKAAEILLNIVLARPPRVYESFLQALETNNQLDAYRLLADDGLCKCRFLYVFWTSLFTIAGRNQETNKQRNK